MFSNSLPKQECIMYIRLFSMFQCLIYIRYFSKRSSLVLQLFIKWIKLVIAKNTFSGFLPTRFYDKLTNSETWIVESQGTIQNINFPKIKIIQKDKKC